MPSPLSLVLQYSTPSTKNNGTVQLAAACQIRELFFFGNRHFFIPNRTILYLLGSLHRIINGSRGHMLKDWFLCQQHGPILGSSLKDFPLR